MHGVPPPVVYWIALQPRINLRIAGFESERELRIFRIIVQSVSKATLVLRYSLKKNATGIVMNKESTCTPTLLYTQNKGFIFSNFFKIIHKNTHLNIHSIYNLNYFINKFNFILGYFVILHTTCFSFKTCCYCILKINITFCVLSVDVSFAGEGSHNLKSSCIGLCILKTIICSQNYILA